MTRFELAEKFEDFAENWKAGTCRSEMIYEIVTRNGTFVLTTDMLEAAAEMLSDAPA